MGERKLSFDDVAVGDEAPVLTHKLTRTDLVKYAGASGDFNPMHHDEVLAKAAGQPSVFGHGMFSMGLLGTALTDYVGVGNLTRYSGALRPADLARRGAVVENCGDGQAGGGREEVGRPGGDAGQRRGRAEGGRRGHGGAARPGLSADPTAHLLRSIWPGGPI